MLIGEFQVELPTFSKVQGLHEYVQFPGVFANAAKQRTNSTPAPAAQDSKRRDHAQYRGPYSPYCGLAFSLALVRGIPTAPARRCLKSSQSGPCRPSTSVTSNHSAVVWDSCASLAISSPVLEIIVQKSLKPFLLAFKCDF